MEEHRGEIETFNFKFTLWFSVYHDALYIRKTVLQSVSKVLQSGLFIPK